MRNVVEESITVSRNVALAVMMRDSSTSLGMTGCGRQHAAPEEKVRYGEAPRRVQRDASAIEGARCRFRGAELTPDLNAMIGRHT